MISSDGWENRSRRQSYTRRDSSTQLFLLLRQIYFVNKNRDKFTHPIAFDDKFTHSDVFRDKFTHSLVCHDKFTSSTVFHDKFTQRRCSRAMTMKWNCSVQTIQLRNQRRSGCNMNAGTNKKMNVRTTQQIQFQKAPLSNEIQQHLISCEEYGKESQQCCAPNHMLCMLLLAGSSCGQVQYWAPW